MLITVTDSIDGQKIIVSSENITGKFRPYVRGTATTPVVRIEESWYQIETLILDAKVERAKAYSC